MMGRTLDYGATVRIAREAGYSAGQAAHARLVSACAVIGNARRYDRDDYMLALTGVREDRRSA